MSINWQGEDIMAEGIKWTKTHCGRMDHGGCALLVGVKDDRIVRIKGDPEGYLNKGYTCYKGRVSADRLNHPHRLRHPLKRVGKRGQGKWQEINWDEALDETAGQLLKIKESYGARAVGFGVGMPKGLEHFVLIRLANIFGSPNVVASQDVCHAPREVSGIHTCGFYPVADLHNPTDLIMAWGSNLLDSNEEGQISSLILQQLKKGAKLVVVDPRRNGLAERADLWLQLKPGTDPALALGFINVIIAEQLYDKDFVENYTCGFEELTEHVKQYTPEAVENITGVKAELICQGARLYAGNKPAALQWGNGIEHDTNVFDSARSLLCLMAITGNLEIPGGNVNAYDPKIMRLGAFVRADLIPDKAKTMIGAHHGTIPRMMTVPPAYFRQAILDQIPYPVKGYYGMCTNPLIAWADSRTTYEALNRLDFIAIADLFMTPTAAMADIVFPVAHQYEINDIGHYGIGHGLIFARQQVVEPPSECWPDIKILNELGKRVSLPELWHDHHDQFLDDVVKPAGMNFAEFCALGCLKGPDRFRLYVEKGFRTPSGKVELKLSQAERLKLRALPEYTGLPEEEQADYPLLLISAKDPNYMLSSYRWVQKLRQKSPVPKVEIHPDTASAKGINSGDEVLIISPYGRIVQVAVITDRVAPNILCADLGWWFPEGNPDKQYDWQKSNFNMLTSINRLGKEFGTPNIKNVPCQIMLHQSRGQAP